MKLKSLTPGPFLFLAGICLSAFVVSPFILDLGLSIRFIILSVFLALCLIYSIRSKTYSLIVPDRINAFYILYALLCLASCIYATAFSLSLFESLKVCAGVLVFLCSPLLFQTNYKDIFLKFSCALPFIGASVAIYQFLQVEEFSKESLYEITGMNGHKNLFSSFLFLNSFFIFQYLKSSEGKQKYLPLIALSVTVLLLIFLQTKAVWIAAVFSGLVFLKLKYILPKFKKIRINVLWSVLTLGVLINLFFLFLLPVIIQRGIEHNIENTATGSQEKKYELDNERLVLWDKTLSMQKKAPLLGVGSGNWQIFIGRENINGLWRAEDLNFTFQRPHNDLLWILSENGWIGFELYLFFLLFLIIHGSRVLQDDQFRSVGSTGVAISFLIGFLVISFFDFPKERIEHLVWFNLILGFLHLNTSNENFKFNFSDAARKFSLQTGLVICLLAVLVSALRFKGEYFTRKIYEAKDSGSYEVIPLLKEKAVSFAYNIDPASLPLSWYSGTAYLSEQNYIKALIELRNAGELNPYNRNVLNDLGTAYAFLKEYGKAKNCFKEALIISPRFDDPALNLADIYLSEKDTLEAAKILRHMYHDSRRRSNLLKVLNLMKTDTTMKMN